MPFSDQEKQHLLSAKFVGETVITRFEQMGIDSLAQLAETPAEVILEQGAILTGGSCWKNSPQAKTAVNNAIEAAKNYLNVKSNTEKWWKK